MSDTELTGPPLSTAIYSHTNKTTGSFIHPVRAGSTSSDRVPALLHRIDLCWMAAVDAAYDVCINISRSRRCCCVDRAISSRLATILLDEGWTTTETRSLDALAVTINIKSRFRCGSRARAWTCCRYAICNVNYVHHSAPPPPVR